MKWLIALLSLGAIAYGATGIYVVGTDQRAVVRRFGKVVAEQSEPGLHFGLPRGLDRVDLIKPSETKTVTVGAAAPADRVIGAAPTDFLSQFLTGDQNLVNVQATVQYTIDDPRLYLFHSIDPAKLIARAAESAVTTTLADQPVDSVLTTNKDLVAQLIKDKLRERLKLYALGVDVRSVSLTAAPPPQLADAFTRAASARSDRERLVIEARTYANERMAEARSSAQESLNKAQARHDRAIDQARSEADRFRSLLYEYQKAPAIAATRLYLETLGDIIPRFRSKIIVDPGNGVDVTIMRDEP